MTFVEIVELFTCYGVDVIVAATITTALTQILKTTALKNMSEKSHTFLPFVIGIAVYAAYAALSRLSIAYLVENASAVLEKGLSVGAVATIIHYIFTDATQGGETDLKGVIEGMLEGFVETGKAEECAVEILKSPATQESVYGIISRSAAEGVADEEILALSKLIAETLHTTP